jgi:hypothetical protein
MTVAHCCRLLVEGKELLMGKKNQVLTAGAAALSLCLSAPAAAASAPAVSPWVMMSAFASPSSSRELCRERDRKRQGEQVSPKQRREADDDRKCALPVGAAAGQPGAVYGTGAAALRSVPLIAGLVELAGFTAYLLATDDGESFLNLPSSPE